MATITVRFIWFDLGYTLAYVNREEMYLEWLEENGISKSMEELVLAYHLADKYFMREYPGALGKKNEQVMHDYYRTLNSYLHINSEDLSEDSRTVGSSIILEWRPFEETILTLKKLKELGIGIGIISNWDETARDVLEKTRILPLMDEVIISSEVGIEKPDERIFLHALGLIDIPANECLYVGDNYYDDVIGSRKVGMDSVLINPFDKKGIEELPDILKISNINELLPTLELLMRERVKEEV